MTDTIRQVILSTIDLDEPIDFYTTTLGPMLTFGGGAHYAAMDGGGGVTLALATEVDHPLPGKVVVIRTDDGDERRAESRPAAKRSSRGLTDHAHERRVVVYDNQGTAWVFYQPLAGDCRDLRHPARPPRP